MLTSGNYFAILVKIRHYTDNLILARLEAEEEEGDEVLKSLTDDHIILTLSDIFFGKLTFFINYWICKRYFENIFFSGMPSSGIVK